jgi:Skp family chaperone for outer membrane proteins
VCVWFPASPGFRVAPPPQRSEPMTHLSTLLRALVLGVLAWGGATASVTAQAIRVTDSKKVLHGSAHQCLKAAVVDYKKLRQATPEYKQIQREGIEKGSAQHEILCQRITTRIRDLLKEYCKDKGYDCVVIKGYVHKDDVAKTTDITAALLEKLEEGAK